MRIAIEYDWLKTIAAKKGESITAAELAEQTKSDELLISTDLPLLKSWIDAGFSN